MRLTFIGTDRLTYDAVVLRVIAPEVMVVRTTQMHEDATVVVTARVHWDHGSGCWREARRRGDD